MNTGKARCPRCLGGRIGAPPCSLCGGAGKVDAPTPKQQQVLDMMAAGKDWPTTAAYVFDTTSGAKIARHGLVRRGWLEHHGSYGFLLTTEGRALATTRGK